ncbi:MAG: 4-hydroxy-tetrahydrodipicolinate synthase [Bacteroidetes bacterium GWF2_38_335]|nr:MAG: 4-hydroxy-tetrahydrodipicolinate synthase [Bacteroidetes bacterium GWF2_38_335]OFY77543.1 MAG: 4-hydroxy-tetrahydrodipicolinate synthase [Bacteroidetes bacterium RIFOXYA12_FULL_38_20]HBS87160.1 4-hydroxy-tetrahydrodipicolinate synthase [Bacteroidales bacterium]
MPQKKFLGTGVALVTPFRKDGSIDFKALEKLVNHVIDGGVNYLVVLGTTSEAATMQSEEKAAVVSQIVEINNRRVPIVVGFGGNNTQVVVDQIQECKFKGIDGILSVTPYYNKPNQKGLYAHFKAVAAACPVPVILYNVPSRTGVNMTAETTLKLAHDVENILAIKEASGNFAQAMAIIKDKPDNFSVISGEDGLTFPFITLGMSGVISVAANAFPFEMSEMVNFALKDKIKPAKEIHYRIIEMIDLLFAEGNPAGVKAALSTLGIIENNLRLPLVPVSKITHSSIVKTIDTIKASR